MTTYYQMDKSGNLIPILQAELVVVDDEDVKDVHTSGQAPTTASQADFIKDNKIGDTTIPQ